MPATNGVFPSTPVTDSISGPSAKLSARVVLYKPMTRPRCGSGVISIIQVSVTTKRTTPVSPPRKRITNQAKIESVLIKATIRTISITTPASSSLRPSIWRMNRGITKDPSITPTGPAIARAPISVALAPRLSRIRESSGVNRLMVMP